MPAGVDFSAPRCRLAPASVCTGGLFRADPRLQSSQHLLDLRMGYINSTGAFAGFACWRYSVEGPSGVCVGPVTHRCCQCHPPVQHSCAGVHRVTCTMHAIYMVSVVCALFTVMPVCRLFGSSLPSMCHWQGLQAILSRPAPQVFVSPPQPVQGGCTLRGCPRRPCFKRRRASRRLGLGVRWSSVQFSRRFKAGAPKAR